MHTCPVHGPCEATALTCFTETHQELWEASHELPRLVGALSRTTPLCTRNSTSYCSAWQPSHELPHFVGGPCCGPALCGKVEHAPRGLGPFFFLAWAEVVVPLEEHLPAKCKSRNIHCAYRLHPCGRCWVRHCTGSGQGQCPLGRLIAEGQHCDRARGVAWARHGTGWGQRSARCRAAIKRHRVTPALRNTEVPCDRWCGEVGWGSTANAMVTAPDGTVGWACVCSTEIP